MNCYYESGLACLDLPSSSVCMTADLDPDLFADSEGSHTPLSSIVDYQDWLPDEQSENGCVPGHGADVWGLTLPYHCLLTQLQ